MRELLLSEGGGGGGTIMFMLPLIRSDVIFVLKLELIALDEAGMGILEFSRLEELCILVEAMPRDPPGEGRALCVEQRPLKIPGIVQFGELHGVVSGTGAAAGLERGGGVDRGGGRVERGTNWDDEGLLKDGCVRGGGLERGGGGVDRGGGLESGGGGGLENGGGGVDGGANDIG